MQGLYWDNGKENGNYYKGLYRDYRGIVFKGYIGRMEKKMETTVMGYIGIFGCLVLDGPWVILILGRLIINPRP